MMSESDDRRKGRDGTALYAVLGLYLISTPEESNLPIFHETWERLPRHKA